MILTLPIKKQWFEMIRSGEKKEDYRDISDHWASRMLWLKDEMEWAAWEEMICDMRQPTRRHRDLNQLLQYFGARFRPFSSVLLINGYQKNAPRHLTQFHGITIGKGRPEWGAPPDKNVFIVQCGK